MNENHEGTAAAPAACASLAIDNLRTILVVLVVAIHSELAYLSFLPAHAYAFDAWPFRWRSFPIIDSERFLGFDLFCAWIDLFVMALFFFVSGLFLWQSLDRKRPVHFVQERAIRLGLPFAIVALLIMPLAHYPVYAQTAAHPGIVDFWRHWLALPLWPVGPLWFLWILLVGDILAAFVYWLLGRRRALVSSLSAYANEHVSRFLAVLLVASALAYIPFALIFGPMAWLQRGPFSFQLSRPGQYAVYFCAGIVIGACGVHERLLAPDGPLARRRGQWLAAAVLSFVLWLGVSAKTMLGPSSPVWQIADALSYVLACFANCCCALGLAMRFGRIATGWMQSLKGNAYGIYLLHYAFVTTLQFALLGERWPAPLKGLIVFAGALMFSWSATSALRAVGVATGAISTR